jgi:hypothetical protein
MFFVKYILNLTFLKIKTLITFQKIWYLLVHKHLANVRGVTQTARTSNKLLLLLPYMSSDVNIMKANTTINCIIIWSQDLY